VIPDPDGAARAWYAKHGLVPVNHMVVVTDELACANPKAVVELYRLLEEGKKAAGVPATDKVDTVPFGRGANRRCLDLLISYHIARSKN
jgi:4,5-dihydroxyphthalate decarboxylase